MNNKNLSERDICTKFITPALTSAGWDVQTQVREEVTFTAGRIIVRGNLHSRGKTKRADDLLYYRPNLPIAVILKKTFCNLLFPLRTTSAACGGWDAEKQKCHPVAQAAQHRSLGPDRQGGIASSYFRCSGDQ